MHGGGDVMTDTRGSREHVAPVRPHMYSVPRLRGRTPDCGGRKCSISKMIDKVHCKSVLTQ